MRLIRPEPISAGAFAPFGLLTQHQSGAVIADACASFEADATAKIPVLEWVRPASRTLLPFRVERLERHPFSAQSFLPDGRGPFVAVVCPAGADGMPDLKSIRAYTVAPDVAVTFRRGVWHHSLVPLAWPSLFVMGMMRTGLENDTEFFTLPISGLVEVVNAG